MNIQRVIIAMYRAMDELYEEGPDNEEMRNWVSSANPYLWLAHVPGDQAIEDGFKRYAHERGFGDEIDPDDAYRLVAGFVRGEGEWGARFDDIAIDEWRTLCAMVDDEEDNRIVGHVAPTGFRDPKRLVLFTLAGKTLKSIEYAKEPGKNAAWGALRLNMGRFAVRVELVEQEQRGKRVSVFTCEEEALGESFDPPGGGVARAYLVGEVVKRAEVVRYAASIDGAPLESRPEDGYDFEWMPGQDMALVIETRHGVRALHRRGADGEFIYVADHMPSDAELGKDEWAAFWAEGVHDVQVRRTSYELAF